MNAIMKNEFDLFNIVEKGIDVNPLCGDSEIVI